MEVAVEEGLVVPLVVDTQSCFSVQAALAFISLLSQPMVVCGLLLFGSKMFSSSFIVELTSRELSS